jgi:hypothetical protein
MSTVVELWTPYVVIITVSCEGTRGISENVKGYFCIWTRKVNTKIWVLVSINVICTEPKSDLGLRVPPHPSLTSLHTNNEGPL